VSTNNAWKIPPSTLHWLSAVPDAPVAVLLRHSVRDHLPPGDAGYALPITEAGVQLAWELGELAGDRLRTLHTSPLPRCIQTAEALRAGAAADIHIQQDRLLGDPGVFVVDGKRAITNWEEKGHEGVMACLVGQDAALPGMAAPDAAARFLVQHMLSVAGNQPGLHIFVTHDSLVTATAARFLGERFGMSEWPWYLGAAFFWRQEECIAGAYRDIYRQSDFLDQCRIEEQDVIEFARREIAQTIGCDCTARFFLAGGAFKTLLTGKPPRDLDLWAPSKEDRDDLLKTLELRGARRLEGTPYAEKFEIGGRIVEVPNDVQSVQLEDRLGRFDIGLSAIGVEFSDGNYRALIHPQARISVTRREIFLLKPLVNWKYALTTLERMRRYAAELNYIIPADEECLIWHLFESQTAEFQRGMIERYDRTRLPNNGLREEALSRMK
jgi:broad specificity phosphatase PhoE